MDEEVRKKEEKEKDKKQQKDQQRMEEEDAQPGRVCSDHPYTAIHI